MVTSEQVTALIKAELSDAEVQVQDMTGGGDHYQVIVISPEFEGKSLVKQHQMVYRAVQGEMASEAIHAFALKTYTPETWQAATGG